MATGVMHHANSVYPVGQRLQGIKALQLVEYTPRLPSLLLAKLAQALALSPVLLLEDKMIARKGLLVMGPSSDSLQLALSWYASSHAT